MRRRKLLVALAGLAVVVAAGVLVQWPAPTSRLTLENLGHLREGMTRAEVEAILGAPGDYSTGQLEFVGQPRSVRIEPSKESHGTDGSTYLQWADDAMVHWHQLRRRELLRGHDDLPCPESSGTAPPG